MNAILMLEDGHSFTGEVASGSGQKIGPVMINTAVVGYQEMLTDPANAGKILVLTYPLIGNYGCAPKFNESKGVWVAGLAIKENSRMYSNWQAKSSLMDFAKKNNLLVISQVDTRSLAVHLRHKGEMWGIISGQTPETKDLLAKISAFRQQKAKSILPKISVKQIQHLDGKKKSKKVAILDLGITNSLIRQLETLGLSLLVLPYHTAAQEILRLKPKGLIISNGPEEDIGLEEVAIEVRHLIKRLPILGISAGHQVLAKALGAKIVKMKLGHHGVNYPMDRPATYKGEITVQNHSYVVEQNSLNRIKKVKVTGYNLNDRSIEEIESKKLKIIGAQYYPASPGFNEVNPILKKFASLL
jgi:carbamoyl-phosphate synthase small subunit